MHCTLYGVGFKLRDGIHSRKGKSRVIHLPHQRVKQTAREKQRAIGKTTKSIPLQMRNNKIMHNLRELVLALCESTHNYYRYNSNDIQSVCSLYVKIVSNDDFFCFPQLLIRSLFNDSRHSIEMSSFHIFDAR